MNEASKGGTANFSAVKVPEVTALFWIIKVLTTGMGETTSDYLVRRFDPILAITVAGVIFAASVGLQLVSRRYVPWIYWLAIVMVSVFGTMVADAIHIVLGVPYYVSTVVLGIGLATILWGWQRTEGTLSIHSIVTLRREAFYWATVLATFALGTAAGDTAATTFGLGYFMSGVAFLVLIAVPALGYRALGWNAVFAFWFAYIVTRPLGASFADWLGVPASRGGLALGTGPVSLVLAGLVVLLVGLLSIRATPSSARKPSGW